MRKHKAAPRRKATKLPNDKRLINECVIYAQSIAAFHDGFKVDSDGDNCHAAALGERHRKRAWQALTKITVTPATTPEGLCSKAQVVRVVFEDNRDGSALSEADKEFLQSFAVEVKNFLQPICDGTVTLQKPAQEGGGITKAACLSASAAVQS
jgi:hypothetical protein